MRETLNRFTAQIRDDHTRRGLEAPMQALGRAMSTCVVRGAGLEIAAGGSALAQVGASSTFVATVNGRLVTIAAGTDMPALVGTVTADAFNVFCFFVNAAGTVTSVMGTEGATLAQVKFPDFEPGKALIGFVIVNPTGTGDFVGGTTPLDDATVAPNAVYVSPVGAFDPTFVYN